MVTHGPVPVAVVHVVAELPPDSETIPASGVQVPDPGLAGLESDSFVDRGSPLRLGWAQRQNVSWYNASAVAEARQHLL